MLLGPGARPAEALGPLAFTGANAARGSDITLPLARLTCRDRSAGGG